MPDNTFSFSYTPQKYITDIYGPKVRILPEHQCIPIGIQRCNVDADALRQTAVGKDAAALLR